MEEAECGRLVQRRGVLAIGVSRGLAFYQCVPLYICACHGD